VMAAGVSGAIISTSPYYKVLTIFIIMFGILVVVTNFIFIKAFGIVGAAAASAISVLAYSLMRVIFLKTKYKMQPFSARHLLILAIGIAAYLISLLVPGLVKESNMVPTLVLDIAVRSTVISLVYLSLVYFLKLSPELDRFLRKIIKRIPS